MRDEHARRGRRVMWGAVAVATLACLVAFYVGSSCVLFEAGCRLGVEGACASLDRMLVGTVAFSMIAVVSVVVAIGARIRAGK